MLSMFSRTLIALSFISLQAKAAMPEVIVEIKNHLFSPQDVFIPANKKVRLIFINHDATPEEIDSFDLNREKVIFGSSKGTIYVGPLPPGTYRFFGEYHPNTAVGTVRVVRQEELPDAD